MKPIHKLNGGLGATLCHNCSVIISTGLTEDLYCDACKPEGLKLTLEEQIRPHTQYWDCYNDCPLEYNHTGKVLKIAEEFAIEFAEWNSYKYKYLPNKGWFRGSYELEMDIFKTSKELLEIFKKEKGL
jgi:hypothetical protein